MSTTVLAVLVVGDDPAARARTLASLAAQTIDVTPCVETRTAATTDAPYLALVTAGTTLAPTACERACWFLAGSRAAGFVTGRGPEAETSGAPLGALLDFLVVRTSDAHAVLGLEAWHAVGTTAGSVPQLAFVLALALLRAGGVGGWMPEPTIAAHAPTPARAQADAASRATLTELSLAEAAFVTERHLGLPLQPLQRLAAPVPPSVSARLAKASGLRILALFQGFPMGGYTAFNADILPRLVARGHAVTVCTTEYWRSDWRLDAVRAATPDVHHAAAVVPLPAIPAYVDHLLSTRAIDVVFMSHSYLAYRLLPLLRARYPDNAFVDYVHTEWFEGHMYGSYSTMSAQWSQYLDAQVVSSEALAASLVRDGADPAKVHVAHIGIDTKTWNPATEPRAGVRAALGASPSTTVLLFAGRVSPEKRPLLAVDALQRLRAEGHDVRLVVAGGGPLLGDVKARVDALGMTAHVELLGELDESTLRSVYAASDVYFAPSEIEGIARTLFEAMAMGVVPVVSDVGGQRELVKAGTGSLVAPQPGTVDDYLPALRQWMDPKARRGASAAARRHVVSVMDTQRTLAAIEAAFSAARRRRAEPQAPVEPSLANEVALMALETTRRHVLRASKR